MFLLLQKKRSNNKVFFLNFFFPIIGGVEMPSGGGHFSTAIISLFPWVGYSMKWWLGLSCFHVLAFLFGFPLFICFPPFPTWPDIIPCFRELECNFFFPSFHSLKVELVSRFYSKSPNSRARVWKRASWKHIPDWYQTFASARIERASELHFEGLCD